MKIKVTSYTDESGQDTKGKIFIVSTIIALSDQTRSIETILEKIEKECHKNKKWSESGNKRRTHYIELLLETNKLKYLTIYYSIYHNKQDYLNLIASHIAKAIFDFTGTQDYQAKIFIDKTNKATIANLRNEIKLFHIKYQKIRGLGDQASALIRLADAVCGLMRDLVNNPKPIKSYKQFSSMIKKV